MHILSNILGIIGVTLILIVYALLQAEKISSKSFKYSLWNLIGSILILFSLYYHWNLSSVVIEIFWTIISAYGVYKALYPNKSALKTNK